MITGVVNPLLDREFLMALDENRHKEIWAKIISLDINELPLEQIEGRITNGGSISIDGASSVRRSCSLQIVAENVDINSYYWGLKTKFKLYIGVANTINSKYDDIIWFPQGIYVISSFSTSQTTNNYTISIQGKDKMCMLNGELGGSMTEPTDFGKHDEQSKDDAGNIIVKQRLVPIKDIIRGAVHKFAKEPMHKILINDIPDYGIQLLQYNSESPMWIFIDEESNQVINTSLDGTKIIYLLERNDKGKLEISKKESKVRLINLESNELNNLSQGFYAGGSDPSYFSFYSNGAKPFFSVAKIEYGQTAGYRQTEITYPGDLILKQGEALTSLFDKIVKMLGEFEYFYDEDGNFIFQHKPIHIQTTWNQAKGAIVDIEESKYSYEFGKNKLFTSLNNNPNLTNVKNDYSIWGTRSGISGAEIPIHLRYALDYKPYYYKAIDDKIYYTDEYLKKGGTFAESEKESNKRDWRELIYQMAIDYNKYASTDPNFLYNIDMKNRIKIGSDEIILYPSGRTGYEQYYIDIEGFWRQLYNPDYKVEWTKRIEPKIEEEDDIPVGIIAEKAAEIKVDTFKFVGEKPENMKEYNVADLVFIERYSAADEYKGKNNKLNIKPFDNKDTCALWDITASTSLQFCNQNGKTYEWEDIKEKPYNSIYVLETDNKGNETITYWPQYVCNTWKTKTYEMQVVNGKKQIKWAIYIMPRALSDENREFVSIQELIDEGLESPKGFLRKLYRYRRTVGTEDETQEAITKDNDRETYAVYHKYLYTKVNGDDPYEKKTLIEYFTKNDQYNTELKDDDPKKYWNKDVYENPHNLNFWFDFMPDMGTISKYSVPAIGQRSKVVNDSGAKAIYFRETPTVVFEPSFNDQENHPEWITVEESEKQHGYTYIKIPANLLSIFTVSSQGKTAHASLEENIYTSSYCSEAVSINSIPIYYLKPNTVIYIKDNDSKINGEYIVNQLTIPLTYNGTMSISATKVPERIY